MRKSFKPILLVAFSFILLLIIFSCKKDEDVTRAPDEKNFSVTVNNRYDYCWVVLNSLNGKEVLDYQKIDGSGTADFGKLNTQITVSIIWVDSINYSGSNSSINIVSYFNVTCGDWKFEGKNIYSDDPLGELDLQMVYPEDNYGFLQYSIAPSSSYYINAPSGGSYNHAQSIISLEEGNKISLYATVVGVDGGYCNWLIDQEFLLNSANEFMLELDKPLDSKVITYNRPVSSFYFYGQNNNRNTKLLIDRHDHTHPIAPSELTIYYPDNIPVDEFSLSLFGSNENNFYHYSANFDASNGIENNIEIPEASIVGEYDSETDKIYNIEINGVADAIIGLWTYHEQNSGFVFWEVFVESSKDELYRSVLPQEVLDDIGEDINMLGIADFGIVDYNTTKSLSDIVERFYMSNLSMDKYYSTYYRSGHGFDKTDNKICSFNSFEEGIKWVQSNND